MKPGRQLGFLWGGVALALVMLAPRAERLLVALPPCPLKAISGYPCPTCGTSRAAQALAELDPAAALAINPLAALAFLALTGGGLMVGLLASLGISLREPSWVLSLPARWLLVLVFLANWIYLVGVGV